MFRITTRVLAQIGMKKSLQTAVKEGTAPPMQIGDWVIAWYSAGYFLAILARDWRECGGSETPLLPAKQQARLDLHDNSEWLFTRFIRPVWMARLLNRSGKVLGIGGHRNQATAMLKAQAAACPTYGVVAG